MTLKEEKTIAEAIKYCKVMGKNYQETILYLLENYAEIIPRDENGNSLLGRQLLDTICHNHGVNAYKY